MKDAFIKKLGILHPVIQAPMLGVTSPAMAAAVSNAGGLGSLPVGGLSAEKTRILIQETKALTDKPFAVNLFTYELPEVDVAKANAMADVLEHIYGKGGIPFNKPDITTLPFYSYREQIRVLIEEGISIASFTFGIPDDESLSVLHANDIITIGTATSMAEALGLKKRNVAAICVQGIEAGGHRGSFLEQTLPQVGVLTLTAQVAARIDLPVIAAGGINNGATIMAAMVLGAAAVQIGTAFICSDESLAIAAYKEAVTKASDTDTELTRTFSGRWARGIKNRFMQLVDEAGVEIPPYPVQNSLTTAARAAAQKMNNADFTNLWAGQNAYGAEYKPVAEIFSRLVKEMQE